MSTQEQETFGSRLREARLSAGLSQSDLSQRSGLPKPTLSRYENDHVLPSLETLGKLASALDVAHWTLLPRERRPIEEFCEALQDHGVTITSSDEASELAATVAKLVKSGKSKETAGKN